MKPGKYQRSKQRCQDLGWKVHDRAQSFVLHELVTYKYVTNPFLLASSSSEQLLCFVHGQGQKREQKHTTKNFVRFPNHSFFGLDRAQNTIVLLRTEELTNGNALVT